MIAEFQYNGFLGAPGSLPLPPSAKHGGGAERQYHQAKQDFSHNYFPPKELIALLYPRNFRFVNKIRNNVSFFLNIVLEFLNSISEFVNFPQNRGREEENEPRTDSADFLFDNSERINE
jgi:hypothetical protein